MGQTQSTPPLAEERLERLERLDREIERQTRINQELEGRLRSLEMELNVRT